MLILLTHWKFIQIYKRQIWETCLAFSGYNLAWSGYLKSWSKRNVEFEMQKMKKKLIERKKRLSGIWWQQNGINRVNIENQLRFVCTVHSCFQKTQLILKSIESDSSNSLCTIGLLMQN